ncbi:spore coat U domain-containing protein [Bosea sp. TWI1241]|uniref:Csu type fimbrial protein n=1 Tax=Bosea sp. TWI1241 TaxID=3148904 RepID=UPI003208B103
MRPFLPAAALFLVAVLFAAPGRAATATGSFQVRINIEAGCTVNSATTLDFGNVGVLAADTDVASTITVQCTATTPYSIGLSAGLHGGSVTTRQMSNGAGTIAYSLWRDAGRSLNWGNTVAGDTVDAVGNGAAQAHTVYGRVPPQTTPAPGLYTDTITVTVTY